MSAQQLELLPAFTRTDLPANIAGRVEVTESDCWLFTGCLTSRGYGCAATGEHGKTDLVHRIAYHAAYGAIPAGLVIDHTCHNDTDCPGGSACLHRRCCNPQHLDAVTSGENSRRSHNTLSGATHCPRGHAYADGYTRPDGRRECRTCRDEKRSSYYPRERERYAAAHPVVLRRRKPPTP